MGASYYVDTLYMDGANAYCVLENPDYGQRILYDNKRVYADNPIMSIDSIDGPLYRISLLSRSVDVNFERPETLQLIDSVVPRYADFEMMEHGYSIDHPLYAVYGYSVDVPGSKVPDRDSLSRWLAVQLGDSAAMASQARVDFKQLGENNSSSFFNQLSQEGDEAPEQSMDLYSGDFYSVYYYNPATYVTYMCYSYEYLGGAHGLTGINLATYSFAHHEGVTIDNLFKPGSDSAVRDLIYESMVNDPEYASSHKVSTVQEVKAELANMDISEIPLPQPALMPEGILFCYQPYEIGPYSDGAHQFLVSWEAAKPYLAKSY